MKLHSLFAAIGLQLGALFVAANESALVQTYQPLDGLGSGEVIICSVACHSAQGHSIFPTEVALVVAPNIPPTNANAEEKIGEHNVAAAAGIKVTLDEDEKEKIIVRIDLSGLSVDENFICTEKEIVGATLECMRLAAGTKLDKMKIEVKTKPEGQDALKKLVATFVKHPKKKPFRWKIEEPAQ